MSDETLSDGEDLHSFDEKGLKLSSDDLQHLPTSCTLSGHDYFRPVDLRQKPVLCDFNQFQKMNAIRIDVFPLPNDTFVILNIFEKAPQFVRDAFLHGNYIAIVTCGLSDEKETTGLICSLMGFAPSNDKPEHFLVLHGLYLADVDLIKKVTRRSEYYFNLYTANVRMKNYISQYYVGMRFDPPSFRRINIQECNIIYSCSVIPRIVRQDYIEQHYICSLNDRMRILFQRFDKKAPEDSLGFVIYILRWLPLSNAQKFKILKCEHVILMLMQLDTYIQKRYRIKCSRCSAVFGQLFDVLFKPSLTEHIHSNFVGAIYDVIYVKNASDTTYEHVAKFNDSWFVGFGWSVLYCLKCLRHVGWRYSTRIVDEDTPFFALSRGSIKLECSYPSEVVSHIPSKPFTTDMTPLLATVQVQRMRQFVQIIMPDTTDPDDSDFVEEDDDGDGDTDESAELYEDDQRNYLE